MTALVTVSINYCDYHGIMPDYSGRFFLMMKPSSIEYKENMHTWAPGSLSLEHAC